MPLMCGRHGSHYWAPTHERHGDHWVISEVPEMLRKSVRRVIFSTRGTDITGVFTPQNGVFAFLWGLGGCRGIDLNGFRCVSWSSDSVDSV